MLGTVRPTLDEEFVPVLSEQARHSPLESLGWLGFRLHLWQDLPS